MDFLEFDKTLGLHGCRLRLRVASGSKPERWLSHHFLKLEFVDWASERRTLPSCLRMFRSSGLRSGLTLEMGGLPLISVML